MCILATYVDNMVYLLSGSCSVYSTIMLCFSPFIQRGYIFCQKLKFCHHLITLHLFKIFLLLSTKDDVLKIIKQLMVWQIRLMGISLLVCWIIIWCKIWVHWSKTSSEPLIKAVAWNYFCANMVLIELVYLILYLLKSLPH